MAYTMGVGEGTFGEIKRSCCVIWFFHISKSCPKENLALGFGPLEQQAAKQNHRLHRQAEDEPR